MLRRWSQEIIPGGFNSHQQNPPPKEQDDQEDFGFCVQALRVVLIQARALFGQKKIPEVGIDVAQAFGRSPFCLCAALKLNDLLIRRRSTW